MKLIKPSYKIIVQEEGIKGVYKQIELVGRICYKSEDKITENSYNDFVEMLKNRKHNAMLEHGTIYIKYPLPFVDYEDMMYLGDWLADFYNKNKYSETNYANSHLYVTTNLRVLIENDRLVDLKYLCEPTKYHEKRVTVKFICDRGVSHEFVRHRVFSFAQESTRFCNYSKDKFGNELTYIIPCWLDLKEGLYNIDSLKVDLPIPTYVWMESMLREELSYKTLIEEWTPQQARSILPNSLKTELVMTGTISQWEGFFELRGSKSAHPQAYELAKSLYEEFIKLNYIK